MMIVGRLGPAVGFLVGMFAGLASLAAACDTPLVLTWEEWRPYSFKSDGRLVGLDIDLTRAIMEEAGCSYEFRQMPWKRSLRMLEQGEIDATPSASFTDKRAAFARFSSPYRSETVAAFARKEDAADLASITSYEEVHRRGLSLVVVRGTYVGAAFEKLRGDLDVTEMTHYRQVFKFLNAGRADMAITDLVNGMTNITQLNFADRLVALPFRPATEPIHFMLSKLTTRREDLDAINVAIRALRESGVLAAITNRYVAEF